MNSLRDESRPTNITDFPTLFETDLRFLIPCLKLRLQGVVWLSCLCNQWKFDVPNINAKVNGSQY